MAAVVYFEWNGEVLVERVGDSFPNAESVRCGETYQAVIRIALGTDP